MDGEAVFRCERLSCTLKIKSCAQRFADSARARQVTGGPDRGLTLAAWPSCRRCPVGEKHAAALGSKASRRIVLPGALNKAKRVAS